MELKPPLFSGSSRKKWLRLYKTDRNGLFVLKLAVGTQFSAFFIVNSYLRGSIVVLVLELLGVLLLELVT